MTDTAIFALNILCNVKPERHGRTPRQMALLKENVKEAAAESAFLHESLCRIDHTLISSDAGLDWNPVVRELSMKSNLRSVSRKTSVQEVLKQLNANNPDMLVPSLKLLGGHQSMRFYNSSRESENFKDDYNERRELRSVFLKALDADINRVLAKADSTVSICWDSIVEPVWDAGGYMDFSHTRFRITGRSWNAVRTDRLSWLAASGVSETNRARISRYRIQAAVLYGEFMDLLMNREISRMIDSGHSIADTLCGILNIRKSTLRNAGCGQGMDARLLQEEKSPNINSIVKDKPKEDRMVTVISVLQAWKVPEELWPRTPESWMKTENREWEYPDKALNSHTEGQPDYYGRNRCLFPLRPDYADLKENEECVDALNFLYDEFISNAPACLSTIRVFETLAGSRKLSGVRDRLIRMHSRLHVMSTRAAVMRGGISCWKGLCDEWTDSDTGLRFVPITESIELAEEGMRMHHCVGSYDRRCMDGSSYIFGIRLMEERIATLEIEDREPNTRDCGTLRNYFDRTVSVKNLSNRLCVAQVREIANRYAQTTVTAACSRFLYSVHSGATPHFLNNPQPVKVKPPVMKQSQIAEALFEHAANIVMPEWRGKTWREWLDFVKLKKGE